MLHAVVGCGVDKHHHGVWLWKKSDPYDGKVSVIPVFRRPIRFVACVVCVFAPVAVLSVAVASWFSDLPRRLPTHWGGVYPDDYATTSTFAWMCVVVGVAAVLVTVGAGVARPLFGRVSEYSVRFVVAGSAAVSATAAGAWTITAWRTIVTGRPEDLNVVWPLLAAIIGMSWGVATYLVYGRPAIEQRLLSEKPICPSRLKRGAAEYWEASLDQPALIAVASLMALAGTGIGVVIGRASAAGGLVFALLMLSSAFVVLTFSAVTVTIDRQGLRMKSRYLRFCFRRIVLQDIVSVTATDVDPAHWGGWGYRIVRGGSAFVLARGQGLVLSLSSDRVFAVALGASDAEQARDVLRSLVADDRAP